MKCGTQSCASDAAVRVHWPGRPIVLCRPCAKRAARIAEAMGFVLSVEPLALVGWRFVLSADPRDPDGAPQLIPWPLCSWPGGCLAAADVEGGRCPMHACACKAIDAGRLGFCRDHRRAFIPADCHGVERQLIIALCASADLPLTTAADGSRVGQPS